MKILIATLTIMTYSFAQNGISEHQYVQDGVYVYSVTPKFITAEENMELIKKINTRNTNLNPVFTSYSERVEYINKQTSICNQALKAIDNLLIQTHVNNKVELSNEDMDELSNTFTDLATVSGHIDKTELKGMDFAKSYFFGKSGAKEDFYFKHCTLIYGYKFETLETLRKTKDVVTKIIKTKEEIAVIEKNLELINQINEMLKTVDPGLLPDEFSELIKLEDPNFIETNNQNNKSPASENNNGAVEQ